MTELGIQAFGRVHAVRLPPVDDARVRQLRVAWADILTDADPTAEPIDLVPNVDEIDAWIARSTEQLTGALLRLAPPDRILLHACAVARDDGAVYGFVGQSGAGKTTLASTLARRLFYVTDEALAVGPGIRVENYRKPLSVKQPGLAEKLQVPVSTLESTGVQQRLQLRALCFLERDAQAGRPRVKTLPLIDAIMRLVPQTSYLSTRIRPLQSIAEALDATGGLRRLIYSEAAQVSALLDTIDRTVSPSEKWRALRLGGTRVTSILDAVAIGDETLVFNGAQVQHLRGVGSTIWRAIARDEDPVAEVLHRHGPPAGGGLTRAIADRTAQLESLGLLDSR